jgi:hypothetical protein
MIYNHYTIGGELYHYGVAHDENPPGRGSGRYPFGSGKHSLFKKKNKEDRVKKNEQKNIKNFPDIDIDRFKNDQEYSDSIARQLAKVFSGSDINSDDYKIYRNAILGDKDAVKIIKEWQDKYEKEMSEQESINNDIIKKNSRPDNILGSLASTLLTPTAIQVYKSANKEAARLRNEGIKKDREGIKNFNEWLGIDTDKNIEDRVKKSVDNLDKKKLKEEIVRKAKDEGKFDLEFTEIFHDDEWELEDDNEKLKDDYIIKEYARYIDDPEHYDSRDSSYEEYKKKK